jgi:hypothetical protein
MRRVVGLKRCLSFVYDDGIAGCDGFGFLLPAYSSFTFILIHLLANFVLHSLFAAPRATNSR